MTEFEFTYVKIWLGIFGGDAIGGWIALLISACK